MINPTLSKSTGVSGAIVGGIKGVLGLEKQTPQMQEQRAQNRIGLYKAAASFMPQVEQMGFDQFNQQVMEDPQRRRLFYDTLQKTGRLGNLPDYGTFDNLVDGTSFGAGMLAAGIKEAHEGKIIQGIANMVSGITEAPMQWLSNVISSSDELIEQVKEASRAIPGPAGDILRIAITNQQATEHLGMKVMSMPYQVARDVAGAVLPKTADWQAVGQAGVDVGSYLAPKGLEILKERAAPLVNALNDLAESRAKATITDQLMKAQKEVKRAIPPAKGALRYDENAEIWEKALGQEARRLPGVNPAESLGKVTKTVGKNLREAAQKLDPRIKELLPEGPGTKLIRTDGRTVIRSIADLTSGAEKNLWTKMEKTYEPLGPYEILERGATEGTPASGITKHINDAFQAQDRPLGLNPQVKSTLDRMMADMPERFTVKQGIGWMRELNADLDGFYHKTGDAQATILNKYGSYMGLKLLRDALAEELFTKTNQFGVKGLDLARRQFGAYSEMHSALQNKIIDAEHWATQNPGWASVFSHRWRIAMPAGTFALAYLLGSHWLGGVGGVLAAGGLSLAEIAGQKLMSEHYMPDPMLIRAVGRIAKYAPDPREVLSYEPPRSVGGIGPIPPPRPGGGDIVPAQQGPLPDFISMATSEKSASTHAQEFGSKATDIQVKAMEMRFAQTEEVVRKLRDVIARLRANDPSLLNKLRDGGLDDAGIAQFKKQTLQAFSKQSVRLQLDREALDAARVARGGKSAYAKK